MRRMPSFFDNKKMKLYQKEINLREKEKKEEFNYCNMLISNYHGNYSL